VRSIPLTDGSIRFAGILDIEPAAIGVRLSRLPAWTHAQLPDPLTRLVVGMPSGCRLEFRTDSPSIAIDLLVSRIKVGTAPAVPAKIDVVVDGEVTTAEVGGGNLLAVEPGEPGDPPRVDFRPGDPARVEVALGGTGERAVEVWLPHTALTEVHGVSVADDARFEPPADDSRRRWIHHGSSISHCLEAVSPTAPWPVVAARRANVNLQSLGFGGSCHLDQFVARTIRDLPADVISLKVGINVVNADSLRERAFGPAVHGFLDTVRDGHPDTPFLLVSPITCPAVEDHPGPTVAGADGRFVAVPRPREAWIGSLTLRRIREILSEIVSTRRAAGDHNLHYLDGLELFGPDDVGDLPDGLHPNSEGYGRMGHRFVDLAFADGRPFASS
jgi:hypothetical protein